MHGGRGFLVGQFLDASNNLRQDGYGSDPAGRGRFVKEVVHAIRERTGPDFHVGLRLSVERHGLVLADMVQLVGELLASGTSTSSTCRCGTLRSFPPTPPKAAGH
ncbi:oxidoreductase [Pseudarthrobacter raffinosi]|uniref:oxidoreductase n=1 Tax=Pseudarthrobacter raffinosi TaxID=2953651 RepID=UPI0035ABF221